MLLTISTVVNARAGLKRVDGIADTLEIINKPEPFNINANGRNQSNVYDNTEVYING